ncbi:response regulator transcription factor [Hahella aquimaris]|uniref:response regulator transcription factor n=1 Tax=Hahella sp. HNIBRBA332 TaxID=3015983 RepID=UPI00273AC048|nr:response regulator transcription factor [Hahella sp. HNIBRBA332]WLQ16343.1 response regulator transcription factor [Hahella sp. HNIBRBA332]
MIHKVLIVDDHPIFRDGLTSLINKEGDMSVCAEASDIYSALELFNAYEPDVVIVDLNLVDSNGLELIKRLRLTSHSVKILVASMHSESFFGERSLRAGANGYICKEETPRSLINALRELLNNGFYMSPKLSNIIAKRHLANAENGDSRPECILSERELEVFTMVGKGSSTKEIAHKLNLSVKTIDTYKEHIKRKLGIKDNTALIQQAVVWMVRESML